MYSPDSDTNREKCVSNNNEEHEEIVVPSNMKCNQSIKVGIEKYFFNFKNTKLWKKNLYIYEGHKSHKIVKVRHKRYFKSF